MIGAGYIAVELAGIFAELGTETSLFVRGRYTNDPKSRLASLYFFKRYYLTFSCRSRL